MEICRIALMFESGSTMKKKASPVMTTADLIAAAKGFLENIGSAH